MQQKKGEMANIIKKIVDDKIEIMAYKGQPIKHLHSNVLNLQRQNGRNSSLSSKSTSLHHMLDTPL